MPITTENNKSNINKKEEGKPLAGGESSADYTIIKSDGDSQLSDKARISATSPSTNPTPNVVSKEKGESLSGGESSADNIIAESDGNSQLSESDKISPTSTYSNPTEINEEKRERARLWPNVVPANLWGTRPSGLLLAAGPVPRYLQK